MQANHVAVSVGPDANDSHDLPCNYSFAFNNSRADRFDLGNDTAIQID
jgi:hypothetical protein